MMNRNANRYDMENRPELNLNVKQMAFLVGVSNTVLVFTRKHLGYRLLDPLLMLRMCLLMGVPGYFIFTTREVAPDMRREGFRLMVVAATMFLMAMAHRRVSRPEGFSAQTHIHTRSRGVSVWFGIFRLLRVPNWFIQGTLEPIAILALGLYLILHVGWVLIGGWLVIASLCLARVETIVTQNERTALMDLRDSRVEAQTLQAIDSTDPNGAKVKNSASAESTATLSPEIQRLRKRR